jgi:8-oxo-dGTP pyrophosphatase MutT (NUDIX family)
MSQYPRIRLIALCLCRHQNKILVMEGHDSVKGESFFRPLGGGVEFGETGAEAVAREFLEEINVDLHDVRYLATIENLFTFQGEPKHEIVLLYDGHLNDNRLYESELIEGCEANGEPIRACWKTLDEFAMDATPLYPAGLLELLLAEDREKGL